MNKNEVVIIALKILCIYILVLGLASIGTSTGINGISSFSNWSLYFGTFIYIVSGIILIYRAESISNIIFKPMAGAVEKFDVSENFQKGALRVLGLYVAIFALPSLIHIQCHKVNDKVCSSYNAHAL